MHERKNLPDQRQSFMNRNINFEDDLSFLKVEILKKKLKYFCWHNIIWSNTFFNAKITPRKTMVNVKLFSKLGATHQPLIVSIPF